MKFVLDEMKFFLYAEIQQKFTYLTSEASSIIESELNFGIIKNFIESKKNFMLKTVFPYNMQLFATVTNIVEHP